MSIVNSKSGRYIKVIRELAVFRPNSVEVSFYSFGSRKEKEDYFARKLEVEKFLLNSDKYLLEKSIEVNEEIEAWAKDAHSDGKLTADDLPKAFRVQLDELSKLSKSVSVVRVGWDGGDPLPKFENVGKLRELGFKDAWFVPLPFFEVSSVHTGAFTNQNFTYECLYAELKKIFKEDFVDC